jgi:hypothetical protein
MRKIEKSLADLAISRRLAGGIEEGHFRGGLVTLRLVI